MVYLYVSFSMVMTGHAFEARIYAENVPKGFLPAAGVLHHYDPVPISPAGASSCGLRNNL